MSLYSDHASRVNAINRDIARSQADRLRRSGEFWGGTLASLGQIPMQILQQRDAQRAADADAAKQAEKDRRQAELDDLKKRELEGSLEKQDADRTSAADKIKREQAVRFLAMANEDNWLLTKARVDSLMGKGYMDGTPDTLPPKPLLQEWQQIIMEPGKPFEAPKGPEPFTLSPGQQRFNPDGTPIALVPPNPVGQTTPANPTAASLAAAAAKGDPDAIKALELLKKFQSTPDAAERLVPVPGPDGKPVYGTPREGQPVYEKPTGPSGETAQDRLRLARVNAARGFLGRLNTLRERINTKMGPAAGATGLMRRGAAAIGMDPDVAEYERERAAAGRALAVAIMGAQNLSDADASAWANLLPDARVDKETAARLMRQVESQLEGLASAPANGGPQSGRIGDYTFEVEP